MECKLVVDQKAICIDVAKACHTLWQALLAGNGAIAEGKIYAVESLGPCGSCGHILVKLKGVESHWHHTGFRPLQDRPKEADTDISVFLPALNVKKLEPVE